MTANIPIILILGAGPNIGQAVARIFASKGYKVALAARSVKEADNSDNLLNIPSDFSKTEDVVNAFDQTKKTFGIPSVVVYNGKSSSLSPVRRLNDGLMSRSQRSELHPPRRSLLDLPRRVQPRHDCQHPQRLCRCAASRRGFRSTPVFSSSHLHHHRQHLERRHLAPVHVPGSRKVSCRSYDLGCLGCVQRSRV